MMSYGDHADFYIYGVLHSFGVYEESGHSLGLLGLRVEHLNYLAAEWLAPLDVIVISAALLY